MEKENIFFCGCELKRRRKRRRVEGLYIFFWGKRNGEGKGGDFLNHAVSEMEVGSDDVDKDDTCDRGDGVTRLMG